MMLDEGGRSASKNSTPICQSLTYCHLHLQCSLMWEHWHPWHSGHRNRRNYSSGLKASGGNVSHACSQQVWRGEWWKKKEQTFEDSCRKDRYETLEESFLTNQSLVFLFVCFFCIQYLYAYILVLTKRQFTW